MLLISATTPSYAALDVGDAAPNFTAQAALGGKVYRFTLADSLAKGPVVLYFFPVKPGERIKPLYDEHQFRKKDINTMPLLNMNFLVH